MIEPYVKEPLSTIFLSKNETKIINLNKIYGGSQIKFKFDVFIDPYIKFSFNEGVTLSSNKSLSDNPIEIILFPDQNGYNVSGAMLTDENKIYSIVLKNIYNEETDLLFLNMLKLPDDLICKKMAKIDSLSIILDCDSKIDNGHPEFVLVNFSTSNNIKTIDQTPIRINNTYNCPGNESFYKSSSREIKFHENYIYRYCKKSNNCPCGSLEVFSVNFDNRTAELYYLLSNYYTLPLSMQDLQIYDTLDLLVLDYHFGLFEIKIVNKTKQLEIDNNCPSVLGNIYYNLHFDCFDKDGIHDDFDLCKLIIASSHYITELTFTKNIESPCFLNNRKNLGENVMKIYETYFSTNYVIIYYNKIDLDSYFLNVYDRNDQNTNVLYQLTLSSESLIRLLTARTDFYFSPNILNKLIVFTKNDHQLYLINIGQNIVNLTCCSPFPPDYLHSAHLSYSVLDLNKIPQRKDSITIKIADFNERDLFSENSNFSINLNLSFSNFRVPIQNLLKGANQQYIIENLNSLNLDVKQCKSSNFIINNPKNIIFLKIIKINLNYYFFTQSSNYLVEINRCLINHDDDTHFSQNYQNPSKTCWNISHEIKISCSIDEIISKEKAIIVKTSESSLFSYDFEDTFSNLKYNGVFQINNKPLACPIFLFNLISSHCLCISYNSHNDFQVSIFYPNGSNQSTIESYTYTNDYPTEVFEYFDKTLLSNDVLLGKGPHCIHILKLTYSEKTYENSLKTILVIDNEFTQVKHDFVGYHFNVIKSLINQKIVLIITNYERNIIAEFSLDDLISPIFSKKYPIFDFALDNNSLITSVNDQYFVVGCSHISTPDRLLLVYDVFQSIESNLVKIIECDQNCLFYFVTERNSPLMPQYVAEYMEFSFLKMDPTGNNPNIFEEYKPAYLKGYLNISQISKSMNYNDASQSYEIHGNYDENAPYLFNVTVFNNLSFTQKNISFQINFNYSNTIIRYNDNLLLNSSQNLMKIDLSEDNQSNLPQFFDGPVLDYELQNDHSQASYFELKRYIEFQSKWVINDKISKYNKLKNISESFVLGNSTGNLMVIPTTKYLFVLDDFKVLMLNLSTIENDEKFDIIDIFNLSEIPNLKRCNCFESDYNNNLSNALFIGCENNYEEPFLYVILYNGTGFDKRIREILIFGIINNMNSLKIRNNFIFIIDQGVDSLNDCSIFIFQIDLPIDSYENLTNSSFLIPLTNLYILNAQSFNVDYLFIYDFELSILGLTNGSYNYGIILNDKYALYFCEISINPNNRIISLYNKSVSDFVLKSNTPLNKLDLSYLLNSDYRDADGDTKITSYWIDSNIFGEFFILISTAYQLMEIKTSRFYFSEYYVVYRTYQDYSGCQNNDKIDDLSTKNKKFLAFPCIMSNYRPYQTYLKLYFKHYFHNQTIQNNTDTTIPILQMLIFPASKFNDFFLISNEGTSKLFVINGTDILEYELSETLRLERKMLNRTVAGNEKNDIILRAVNNISTAEFKLYIDNGFFIENDWIRFYILVIAPLIFCLCGMIVLCAVIKYSRTKRKSMLLKLRE